MVTGAGGQVGVDLVDTLGALAPPGSDPGFQPDERPVARGEFVVTGLNHRDLDVTDQSAVMDAVVSIRPDVIVHLAAYTAVDRAETERDRCFSVNEGGTASMSHAARSIGAHLIAVSTDYVFDGTKGEAYVEGDPTNPLSVYGASKRAGELFCTDRDTIVRTSWVMGVRGKNVVHAIAARAKSGECVRFVDDQMGTVTTAGDLARALVTLARERVGGVWHVANSDATTWFEIATYVGQLSGRGDDFATAISTEELLPPQLAARPRRSDLSTQKFSRIWSPLPDWHDGVARLVNSIERMSQATP